MTLSALRSAAADADVWTMLVDTRPHETMEPTSGLTTDPPFSGRSRPDPRGGGHHGLDRLADLLERGPVRVLLMAAMVTSMVIAMLLTAAKDAPTVDEPIHFAAAVELGHHDLNWNPDHPVLARALATIALRFAALPPVDRSAHHWVGDCCTQDQDRGLDLLYRDGKSNAQHRIFLARLASILLAIVAVAAMSLLAGQAFGPRAALAALALACTSPVLIAHGHLLTTDISVTAFTLVSMAAALHITTARYPWRWLTACGVFAGLAMASKYTALVTTPAIAVLAAWALAQRVGRDRTGPPMPDSRQGAKASSGHYVGRRWIRPFLAATAGVGSAAVVTVWLVYLAIDPHLRFDRPSIGLTPHGVLARLAATLPLPKPFRLGAQTQVLLDQSGRVGFMFGHRYSGGSPLYYPAMVALKTPLVGLAACIFCLANRRRWPKPAKWLSVVAAVQLLFAMASSTNIGIRHILLVVAFMAVLGGGAVTWLSRRGAAIATVTMMLAGLFVTWTTYPSFLPYANAAFGGTSNAYKLASNSNVDWGQDLWRLADYVDKNLPDEQIWMGYFGWAPIEQYLPKARWAKVGDTGLHGVLALSASIRTVIVPTAYDGLIKGKKPFKIIGGSILLYRI